MSPALVRDRRAWPALMGLIVVAVNLAFLPRYAVNWDNVNFLLGVDTFDVLHHQPHPPGYIGYITVGRWLTQALGDPQTALAALSAVSAGFGTAGIVVLARRMMAGRWALVAGALFGSSPLVLYYGRVGLTYAAAAALAIWVGVAAHRARDDHRLRHLLLAAVLLAVLGSIRQTDPLMMAPVVIAGAWRSAWSDRLLAAGLFGALTLVWLVPLIVSTGGLVPYLQESSALASYAGGRTNLLGMQLAGLVQNVSFVVIGLLIGLCAAAFLLLLRARWSDAGAEDGAAATPWLAPDDRRFLLLWTVPALLVFLLIHTGQIGYMLLVLPPVLLAVVARAGAVGSARPAVTPRLAGLTAALVALNLLAFQLAPTAVQAVVRPNGGVADVAHLVSGATTGWDARTRQYDLAANDRYWDELLDHLHTYDPTITAVVTSLTSGSSFRHLAYYLDQEYWIVALGRDLEGDYGPLFAGRDRLDYSVQALERSMTAPDLPPEVANLVIVADDVVDALDSTVPRTTVRLDSGTKVTVADVAPGTRLAVCEDDEEEPRVTVDTGGQSGGCE